MKWMTNHTEMAPEKPSHKDFVLPISKMSIDFFCAHHL